MRISIWPKTSLGWWSFGIVAANILFFVLALVELGPRPHDARITGYTFITYIAVIAGAIVLGLISIIKNKERSIVLFMAMVIGLGSSIGVASLLGLAK